MFTHLIKRPGKKYEIVKMDTGFEEIIGDDNIDVWVFDAELKIHMICKGFFIKHKDDFNFMFDAHQILGTVIFFKSDYQGKTINLSESDIKYLERYFEENG